VHDSYKASDVQKYKKMSCSGLAKGGEEFDAVFTTYFKPVYGYANGFEFPRRVASTDVKDLANPGEAVTGNAPGTNASWAFFCAVGMDCSCPQGYETSLRCYADAGTYSAAGSERGWSPCKPFSKTTPYCDNAGKKMIPNQTVAADNECFTTAGDCQIRVDGIFDLTITDTGGAIQGRRFDLYTDVNSSPLFETGIHHVKVLNPKACSIN